MTQNLLAQETSPYLLQHKDNPVHWRPWGAAALRRAKTANKPILLSIGYAACHWCHVMAHESFEDEAVAAVMNDLFVNIKVDREERPDIDHIYMSALHLLGEQGGWPLTMFLTPDAEPFWGGTYFPKEPRYGRPGFVQVLTEVARIFRDEPDKIDHNRAAIRARLATGPHGAAGQLSAALVDTAAERILSIADPANGGIRGAPKFPQTSLLEVFWRAGERRGATAYRDAVMLALTHMAQGGIYDHLGGGYARYSVDAHWLVPHFEKMLYDNALLIDLMTLAWPARRSVLLRARVEETIGWMMAEMHLPGGAFASSLDADSDGVEGRFYVWTEDEVRALLERDEFALFAARYDITPDGNFEGRTILNRLPHPTLGPVEEEERLARARAKLLATRARRIRPGLDDKVLADWNGLAIHALARAGFVFNRPDWIAHAREAFAFVTRTMADGDRLWHTWRAGRAANRGLLGDYASMIRAALALYELDGDENALAHARTWSETLEHHFLGADGSYYMSPDDADDLIVRPKTGHDDAMPNGNAAQAANLIRLWHLTGRAHYRERADAIFSSFAAEVQRNVPAFGTLLNAYDLAMRAVDVVLVGAPGAGLIDALRHAPAASLIVARVTDGGDLPAAHPAHGKQTVNGRAAAYVCTQNGCSLPLTEGEALATHLAALTQAG